MESIWSLVFLNFLVVCGLLNCCNGGQVSFFEEHFLNGKEHWRETSPSCQIVPSALGEETSVRSTKCVVVFYNDGCIAEDSTGKDFIVYHEVLRLWNHYKSFRDCNDLEKGHEVNFDYYTESGRKGELTKYRDVCGCTNFPPFNSTKQSMITYGSNLIFFKDPNCRGLTRKLSAAQWYTYEEIPSMRSVIPINIGNRCSYNVDLYANILKFEPVSDLRNPENGHREVSIAPKQTFFNNSSQPIEHIYEGKNPTADFVEIQLSGALNQITYIQMRNTDEFRIVINSTFPFTEAFKTSLIYRLADKFRSHSPSRTSDTIKVTVGSNRGAPVQKKFVVPPCTKYEVFSLMETIETSYRIHLSITGQRGGDSVNNDLIQKNLIGFANVSITDGYTLSAESTAKLIFNYTDYTNFNLTTTPIPECRLEFLKLTAHIFNIQPISNISNFEDFLHQIPGSDKEIFINNGTASQEDSFESTKQIYQTGQFEFPEELNRINYISIENDFESSIPFITTAWGDLKNGLRDAYNTRQNVNEPFTFITTRNKTYNFQKKINVPPCQKYEVNSLLEIAKDIEIKYRIRMQVTGKLNDDVVGVDEIRDKLEGLTFLLSEQSETVIVESTITLKSTFGVSSGVIAEGTNIVACLEAHTAAIENCKFAGLDSM